MAGISVAQSLNVNKTLNVFNKVLNNTVNKFNSKVFNINADFSKNISNTMNNFSTTMNNYSSNHFVNNITFQVTDQTGDAIQKIENSVQALNGSLQQTETPKIMEDVNDSAKEAGENAEGLKDKLKNFASSIVNSSNAKTFWDATIGGAAEQQKMLDTFQARLGDVNGSAMFDSIKKNALAAGQDVQGSLQAALSFYNGDTEQTKQLTDFATHLSVFDQSGGGIQGAADAVKSAMSGDTEALSKNYNISPEAIQSSNLVDSASSGNMDDFIQSFNQLLTSQGMAQDGFDKMLQDPTVQVGVLGNSIKSAFVDSGTAAIQGFQPLITMINDAFQDGKFQPFFDGLSNALSSLVQGVALVIQYVQGFGNTFNAIMPYVAPIIMGIVAAIGFYLAVTKAVQVATEVWATIQEALNLVMSMNPISLIILLIVGLIAAFLAIIATLQPVREFVAEVFKMMGDVISKSVGWYIDMWTGFINGFIDGVNIFLSGINKVINGVGSFLGIKSNIHLELDKIDSSKFKASITNGIESTLNAAADFTTDFNVDNIKKKLKLDTITKNASNSSVVNHSTNNINLPELPATPPSVPTMPPTPSMPSTAPDINHVGRVDEVGKIDDTVDISSEDLKTMRDLAEMKNIQNFVSMTPSVHVTHTGDILNGYDVDAIVGRIKTSLETEIASSAQGVYG